MFTLWEGGIKDPIEDNRYIGTYHISGKSLPDGTVPIGAEIICNYEMTDAGALRLGVTIPCIGVNLPQANFYSRQEGQTALDDKPNMLRQFTSLERRLALMQGRLPDSAEIEKLNEKTAKVRDIIEHSDDPEDLLQANNDLLECMHSIARVRQAHLRDIRLLDLDQVTEKFNHNKSHASEEEVALFNVAREAALRAVDRESGDFELRLRADVLLWRQDDIIEINLMQRLSEPGNFTDRMKFDQLRAAGLTAQRTGNYQEMRRVLAELFAIEKPDIAQNAESMMDKVNVVRK